MAIVRGHNEGTIFPRRGRWVASVRMRDGRRPIRTCPHAHEPTELRRPCAESKRLLADLIRLRDAGATASGRAMTVGRYLRQWVSSLSGLAPATIRHHEMIVRVHLEPAFRRVPLAELAPSDVDAYLSRPDLDGRTLRHHRSTLRRALHDAERDGLVGRNAARLSRPPVLPDRPRRVLTRDDVRALIDGTRGTRWHVLWVLGATAGLRSSEALGLAWSDVDLDAAQLTVRYQLVRQAGQWQRARPKTVKSRRTIPLAPVAVRALREHRELQSREMGDRPRPLDSLVFTTTTGLPQSGTNVLPFLYRDLNRLGLPRVTYHALRHSAASIMVARGVPIEMVAAILGHSSVRITNDLYTHLRPDDLASAARSMQEAVG